MRRERDTPTPHTQGTYGWVHIKAINHQQSITDYVIVLKSFANEIPKDQIFNPTKNYFAFVVYFFFIFSGFWGFGEIGRAHV